MSGDSLAAISDKLAILENKMDGFGSQMQRIEGHLARFLDLYQSASSRDSTSVGPSPQQANNTGTVTGQSVTMELEHEPLIATGAAIPDEILLAVIDTFFECCHNQPYSFFHEASFRRQLSERILPSHLILAVMATATRFCLHPYFSGRTFESSVQFADQAWKSIVSNDFKAGNATELATVQTMALLGLFDFTAGKTRHSSAWVKVGIAVRMAQDCGLMLENATHLSYAEQEERRRVFWSVYLLDRLVSCGRGRPVAILDASCVLQLPCEEAVWRDGLWKKTPSLDELTDRSLALSKPRGSFAQVVVMAYILGRVAQHMLQDFNIRSTHPPWDPLSEFSAVQSDLLHLENHLEIDESLEAMLAPHLMPDGRVDTHCTGPVIFSRALFHLCHCLLNHPFLLRRRIDTCGYQAPASFLSRSFDLGWYHTQQLVDLIRDAHSHACLFHSSFSGYCIIIAGSIAALRTHHADSEVRTKGQRHLEECMTFLDDVGRYWRNVSTMAHLLRQLANDTADLKSLCDPLPQAPPLSTAAAETMWSIVDYSTMSNKEDEEYLLEQTTDIPIWPNSWFGLFGTFDDQVDSNFTA